MCEFSPHEVWHTPCHYSPGMRDLARDAAAGTIIGVDVGATTMSGGLVKRDGEVLAVRERPTHEHGPRTAVDQLMGVIRDLMAEGRTPTWTA